MTVTKNKASAGYYSRLPQDSVPSDQTPYNKFSFKHSAGAMRNRHTNNKDWQQSLIDRINADPVVLELTQYISLITTFLPYHPDFKGLTSHKLLSPRFTNEAHYVAIVGKNLYLDPYDFYQVANTHGFCQTFAIMLSKKLRFRHHLRKVNTEVLKGDSFKWSDWDKIVGNSHKAFKWAMQQYEDKNYVTRYQRKRIWETNFTTADKALHKDFGGKTAWVRGNDIVKDMKFLSRFKHIKDIIGKWILREMLEAEAEPQDELLNFITDKLDSYD